MRQERVQEQRLPRELRQAIQRVCGINAESHVVPPQKMSTHRRWVPDKYQIL